MSSIRSLLEVFQSRKLVALLLLGFFSGLPLFLTSRTLQLWMQDAKVDLGAITLFGLVGLPYSLKFVWSPLLDRFTPPFLGPHRSWLVLTQAGLVLAIGAMALQQPSQNSQVLQVLAITTLAIAFLSATQDIAGDAYRTDVLAPQELESGASLWVWGYRAALFITSSLALVLADYLPWNLIYGLIALLMALGLGVTFWAPRTQRTELRTEVSPAPSLNTDQTPSHRPFLSVRDGLFLILIGAIVVGLLGGVVAGSIPLYWFYCALTALLVVWIGAAVFVPEQWLTAGRSTDASPSLQDAVVLPLRDFFHRFGHLQGGLILVFIVLYKLGDSLVGITGNLFLREIGFTKTEIGTIQGGMGFLATTVGVVVGGVLMTRLGINRSLWIFGILQLLSNLGYYALAVTGKDYSLLVLAINIENFSAGMVTVATVAFLMSLCTHQFTTTQFALFSSLMAIGRDILSAPAGGWAQATGWPTFFLLTLVVALPGLFLLPVVAPWKQERPTPTEI
ncbi:MAG: MFS transporter [Leptolyngbyaceae cyanobacterium bins.59]|nr:MFS transporter [Leptolyngbyaceae cyanobacterium bins.59]